MVVIFIFFISIFDIVFVEIFWKGMCGYFEFFIFFIDVGMYFWGVLVNINGNYVFSMSFFFVLNYIIELFNKFVKLWFD